MGNRGDEANPVTSQVDVGEADLMTEMEPHGDRGVEANPETSKSMLVELSDGRVQATLVYFEALDETD